MDFGDAVHLNLDELDEIICATDNYSLPEDTTWVMADDFSSSSSWVTLNDVMLDPSIKIGKHSIDENMLDKLTALLDVIESLEDDHDFKAMYNTQLSMNKLRGDNENQSN